MLMYDTHKNVPMFLQLYLEFLLSGQSIVNSIILNESRDIFDLGW